MICRRRSKVKDKTGRKFDCAYYIGVSGNAGEQGFCRLRDEFLCIERLAAGLPRQSFSSVSDWITCKRLYFLKHIKGITRLDAGKSSALKRGALWDMCLQVLANEASTSKISELITKFEIGPRDVAKVKALYRGWKELDIQIDTICKTQHRFELPMTYDFSGVAGQFVITGIFDRLYEDYFLESKLSGSPERYDNLWNIIPQVGTYFLVDPGLRYCIMEIVRSPDLRSTGKLKDESDEQYEERCFQDIISRPSHYFLGYDKDSRTFGRKFYRTEFPLEEIKQRYSAVHFEIAEAANRDGEVGAYWKDWNSCLNQYGSACEYLDVCQYDKISEELFTMRSKPKAVGREVTEAERIQLEANDKIAESWTKSVEDIISTKPLEGELLRPSDVYNLDGEDIPF